MYKFGKIVQWIAIAYFVVVVATAILVEVLVNTGPDANFAGVYLIAVTLPLSAIGMAIPLTGLAASLMYVGFGLVQAAILWIIGRIIVKKA
ncbi:MAG TPA: hypothetical protein VE172_16340 [Stackebrandtia sp.]|uniref:SCO4225 family membrane protein n=1 Tax=Stackebrandtia sp. TaxID=2023065 RepID=UPI002D72CDDE|nr:hypothetical protein [Stackebrandtia sp.]HZE40372.1 hypothetical protein [Stackebrandtia sp.]